jgi:hypothetical protein
MKKKSRSRTAAGHLGTHCGATSYEITVTFKAARPAMATKGNAIKALGKP